MKLYIDPGHGGSDPGAMGNGLQEKDVVLDIAKQLRSILLKEYARINIRMSRVRDQTKSLAARTQEANRWGADYFVSIHCNAYNGKTGGYEDYIYNGLSNSSHAAIYQKFMHREIVTKSGFKNRGKKKANFHVLRETTMPAFLSENGFIDYKPNADQMKKASWIKRIAEGHAKGIAIAFNLKPKQAATSSKSTTSRGIAGSFRNKKNADQRAAYLKSKGIASYVPTRSTSNPPLYRVQAGAFKQKKGADKQVNTIEQIGIKAFVVKN